MVVATSARLWPASERTASEPEASPAANFAAVISALTAIEASAALSFSRLAPFIEAARCAGAGIPLIGPLSSSTHQESRHGHASMLYTMANECLALVARRPARTTSVELSGGRS